jgi:Ca-activated chloride channel family protein
MRPDQARTGTLLLEGTDGLRAAPTLSTDVDVRVTGLIARTEVVQRFSNPSEAWVEGVYVFPLPEDAAVDTLVMRIGERVLEGQIQERAKARATYVRAKREGRKASLVEQERPNIFTTSVTNLGPGETVEIAITYQDDVPYDQGRFSLRFPMVVGPRYIPGGEGANQIDESGWTTAPRGVTDADRISPPIAAPGDGVTHPVSINVRLDTGFRLEAIRSPSHPVDVEARPRRIYEIGLQTGAAPADSDFILEWTPVVGDRPTAALFHENWEGEDYALVMVMPPSPKLAERARLSRETIFVIDTSGSMDGASIIQARNALDLAVSRLRPEDSFNIIRFDSTFSKLYPESRQAHAQSIDEARQWVSQLRARGGTEMQAALGAALTQDAERSAVRQVIFITDGAVGNEASLFQTIRDRLGRSRLYTIGIGSAPNSHFMAKAAQFGRGTSTTISRPAQVEQKMNELFAKLDSPVLHDLEIDWDVSGVEMWPARIPDVYLGEPIVVAARMPSRGGQIRVKGRRGGENVTLQLPLVGGSPESGIARLWARRKVKSLVDSLLDGAELDRVSEEVTTLGIRHHIVTRWTSLVAVDVTPTRPVGVELDTWALPSLLPKGWTLRGLFGRAPASDPTRENAATPDLRLASNRATSQPNGFATPGRLPQGATPAALWISLGSALLGASGVAWKARRRS